MWGGARSWPVLTRRGRTRLSQIACLLLSIGLPVTATACGSYVDGDQWVEVTVTNTTSVPATLAMHPTRYLSPGQKTALIVNSNSNPQAVRVRRQVVLN